jgi:hypothetical protein
MFAPDVGAAIVSYLENHPPEGTANFGHLRNFSPALANYFECRTLAMITEDIQQVTGGELLPLTGE